MAIIYLRSTDGNNSDNGSTWALAKATFSGATGASGVDAPGDVIYVSQSHIENGAGAYTFAFAGSEGNPEALICVNDSAEPPTALATTALFTAVGNIGFTATYYVYGIICQSGTGGNSHNLGNSSNRQVKYEQCEFRTTGTNTNSGVIFNSATNSASRTIMINCRYKFSHASHGLAVGGLLHEIGGSFSSGTTAPTTLFKSLGPGIVLFEGTDFTNLGTSFNVSIPPINGLRLILRRAKFASGWSGGLISSAVAAPARISMYNYTIGTTDFMVWIEDFSGVIKSETTLVMTNGASDGITAYSWKMVSNSNVEPLLTHLISDEMVIWSDAVGGSPDLQKTITVNILHDSATNLTNDEVWLEVQYLGSNSTGRGSYASDRKADTLATAADQDSSSEAWTTTGMSNPNKQKLVVTVTPGQKGFYSCRVVLAKASKTIYVDPAPVLS